MLIKQEKNGLCRISTLKSSWKNRLANKKITACQTDNFQQSRNQAICKANFFVAPQPLSGHDTHAVYADWPVNPAATRQQGARLATRP